MTPVQDRGRAAAGSYPTLLPAPVAEEEEAGQPHADLEPEAQTPQTDPDPVTEEPSEGSVRPRNGRLVQSIRRPARNVRKAARKISAGPFESRK